MMWLLIVLLVLGVVAGRKWRGTHRPPPRLPVVEPVESHIDSCEVRILEKLGSGAFGAVHKGIFRGTEVAVKLLEDSSAFRRESTMLARLRHPNVCLFMATCDVDGKFAIVTELVDCGSLWDVLRSDTWRPDCAAYVGLGIARGLAYLHDHTPPVVHRDVKSPNILLHSDFHVKLCDVGLARNDAPNMTLGCGTCQWMAPEILVGHASGTPADVYAFGIVLSELTTRRCPYDDTKYDGLALAMQVVHNNLRPHIGLHCPNQLADLAKACWAQDPDARPAAANAIPILQALDRRCRCPGPPPPQGRESWLGAGFKPPSPGPIYHPVSPPANHVNVVSPPARFAPPAFMTPPQVSRGPFLPRPS